MYEPRDSRKQRVLNDLLRSRRSHDSAPRLPPFPTLVSLCQSSCVSPVDLIDGRGGTGWARSQILRLRESLDLYKSYNNTLWLGYGVVGVAAVRPDIACGYGEHIIIFIHLQACLYVWFQLPLQ
jgi:hypothetical protein